MLLQYLFIAHLSQKELKQKKRLNKKRLYIFYSPKLVVHTWNIIYENK